MPHQIPVSEAIDNVIDQIRKDDLKLTPVSYKMILSIIEDVCSNEEYFIYKTFLEWLSTEYFKI